MSIKIVHINHILNSNNQEIFSVPSHTLLDKILPELWSPIINYYYHHRPFVIGGWKPKYNGYRMITQPECETDDFKKLFEEYREINKGLYSMDNMQILVSYRAHLGNKTDAVM
mgnify:CR=1 FL=1